MEVVLLKVVLIVFSGKCLALDVLGEFVAPEVSYSRGLSRWR